MKRKNISLALIAAVSFSCIWFCGCSEPQEPLGTLLDRATRKAAEGDWTGADQLAKRALKQDPDNADALMLLALSRNNLDLRNEAVEYAIRASRAKPDHFLPHYIQGMLLSKNGKPDLALRALKEARRFRPDDVNTLILLVENSIAVKRYKDAAGYFKLLARDQTYRTSPYLWNGLGVCYTESSPDLALKFYRMAERYGVDDPCTVLNLGVLHDRYLHQEDHEKEARRYYERFVRIAVGKTEYDSVRGAVEIRLESMKGN